MKNIKTRIQTLHFKLFVILTFVGFFSISAAAQSKIVGKIVDKVTGESLIGVTVSIKGTTTASSTDLDGKYELRVAPGAYNLIVRYIAYRELELKDIVVSLGAVTYQDIALEENIVGIAEVEVRAKAKQETIAAVYTERKNFSGVSDGIPSAEIRKTPDKTVGDALKRVSGTSIQDNKFAIIRGMSDRYNAAYLNGAPLPSTESDRKAFAFNIIPTNLIDNLMIYKAPSPELLADFAGGVIVINTKSIPDSKSSVFNFSLGYHSITTFQPFNHYRKSKTDILGFDNGLRKMPVSESFNSGKQPSYYVDVTKQFNNDWKVREKTAMPNTNLGYTWGRSFRHHKNSFGTLASFNYASNNKYTQVQQKKFRYDDNNLDQFFTDNLYTNNISMGALLNFAYKFKTKHTVTIKNLFNQNSDDITTIRTGLASGENGLYAKSSSNIYSQNRIFSSQIAGDHLLNEKKHKLNWVLNAGNIFRYMPDYRIVSYAGEGDNPEAYTLAVNNNQFSASTGRFYSEMTEMIISGAVNYMAPFKFKSTKNEFKAGVFLQDRNRKFNSRYFTYQGSAGITGTPEVNLGEDNIKENGVYMVEQSSPARDNYDARASLSAGYLMMDTRLLKDFRFVYGVRYENYHQKINTADGSNLPLVIDSTFSNFFPSLNFTYSVNEKSNLRLSAGKTINRPEFRELAAFPFYNFNLNSNIAGNPLLKPAIIWNYDARWELFPKTSEVISVGAFYKKIINPIEMGIDVTQVAIRTFGYDNQKSANNYGIELEYRKSFDFIAKATGKKIWQNFLFYTNLTLIKSTITFNDNSSASNDRPLQGQSPYVLNSGLQYNNAAEGWGFSFSYNKIGRRIAYVGAPKQAKFGLDIYENPRDVIDLQITKTVQNWDFKITAGDLLAQDLVYYQGIDGGKKYDSTADNTIFKFKMGQTITAGISYKFH